MRRPTLAIVATLAALAASPLLLRADTPSDGRFPWRETEEFQVRNREKLAKVVRGTDGRDWTTVSGKHYQVATELDPRFTAELSEFLDVFRDHVQQIFTSPVKVFMFLMEGKVTPPPADGGGQ